MKFELGVKVRDDVTGFQGTVTIISNYLEGSSRALVEAINCDGEPIEKWVEVKRLTVRLPKPE